MLTFILCYIKLKDYMINTRAFGTGPSPTWQSNTTHVKQTIIIYKHNIIIKYISLVIYVYDLYQVNFTLFNAYRRYKVLIKVKGEDSVITVSTEIGPSGCYQLNSILFF